MILGESLRPALGDQLVDEFAIAGTVGERAAVGLRRCVARPWCWPCSPSGTRPDRSGGRCRQPAIRGRGRWRHGCVPLPMVGEGAGNLRIRPSPLAIARARERNLWQNARSRA